MILSPVLDKSEIFYKLKHDVYQGLVVKEHTDLIAFYKNILESEKKEYLLIGARAWGFTHEQSTPLVILTSNQDFVAQGFLKHNFDRFKGVFIKNGPHLFYEELRGFYYTNKILKTGFDDYYTEFSANNLGKAINLIAVHYEGFENIKKLDLTLMPSSPEERLYLLLEQLRTYRAPTSSSEREPNSRIVAQLRLKELQYQRAFFKNEPLTGDFLQDYPIIKLDQEILKAKIELSNLKTNRDFSVEEEEEGWWEAPLINPYPGALI